MVQLTTRESSQGDGGEYPAHPPQPRPILPQENHPHSAASLEHHQPRPPSSTNHPSSSTAAAPGALAPNAPPPPPPAAPLTHPPPHMNLKYPDHPPLSMSQQGTNQYYPPPGPTAYYTTQPKDEPRDDYNPGGKTTSSRPSIRESQNFPTDNYSSSNRNYGTYPGDKENYHRGANSSRHRNESANTSRHRNDREKYYDKHKSSYSDRDKSVFNDRDISVYSDREKSVYNDRERDKSVYSDRDSNYARHRGKHRDGGERSGDRYREIERDEDIKPKLERHFEPIRSNDNGGQRRGRTESVTSVFSVASSRAPPIGGGSSRRPGYEYPYDQYGTGQQQQHSVYEQYKYYYQYYRDHPYYKEYYRQWMQQYEQQYPEVYMADRSSLHSGRSSVNDDTKKSVTSQFVQDFHGRSSVCYEPSSIYAEVSSMSHLKSYPSGDLSAVGSIPDESVNDARMTPLLFGRAHIKARFTSSGQLLVVLPKDPRDGEKANVQIRNIQKTLVSNPEMGKIVKKMQEFPGPLTIAETHKEVVVKYCERRIAEASADCQLSDKSSVILMWEYLALLVRQNGRLYGTDIARLLLKGQNESDANKEDHKDNENVATPSALNNEQANFINSPDSGLSLVNTTDFDLASTNAAELPSVPIKNEAELIKKFTEYLCLGRKREALDYAMQEGLWGHCLALAARMDSNTHTRVLTSFLNDIPRHNVLQTLFQQLTGKKPEITKTYSEERWGDWQSHLAMMISNPTGNTEKDAASVLTLGDTLAKRGQLHAAHFCYLLATAEWGTFSNKDSKIVLIGADHQLSFQEFASNESIQCTEIYEYGRSLEDTSSSLPSFQSYKLIYALRLAEAGLPQEALKYCEIINNVVQKTATFQVEFLSQVYNLASCLKYNDVHYQMCQGELSEMPDPDWLLNLKQQVDTAISKQYSTESVAQHAGYGGSNISTGDYVDQASAAATSQYPGAAEVSGGYQHQVSNTASDTTAGSIAVCSQSNEYPSGNYPSGNYASGNYETQDASGYYYNNNTDANTVNTESIDNTQDQQKVPQIPMVNSPSQQENEMLPNSVQMMPATSSYPANSSSSMLPPQTDFVGGSGEENIQQNEQQQQQQQQWSMQPESINGTDTQESPQESSPPIFMAVPRVSAAPAHWQPGPPMGFMPPAGPSSALPPQNHYQGGAAPPEPQPQIPPMPSSQQNEDNDWSNTSSKSKASSDDTLSEGKKEESKKAQSGGLLSYFGFGGKKTNQAILPDDKDPTIKWNEKTQKWESADGSTDVAAPPPPPPKMGGPGGPPGALAVSSMRQGARKSRYINTEKSTVSSPTRGAGPPPMPGGSSNFSNLAPITPMMPLSSDGVMPQPPQPTPMMMPTSGAPMSQPPLQDMDMPLPTAADNAYAREPDNQQQGAAGSGNDGGGGIPMMMAPPSGGGQIAFFNPAQMTPGAPTSTAGGPSSSSQQRRLVPNRRVYPTK